MEGVNAMEELHAELMGAAIGDIGGVMWGDDVHPTQCLESRNTFNKCFEAKSLDMSLSPL